MGQKLDSARTNSSTTRSRFSELLIYNLDIDLSAYVVDVAELNEELDFEITLGTSATEATKHRNGMLARGLVCNQDNEK